MAKLKIVRKLDIRRLAQLYECEAAEAGADGYLAGNKEYRDLRGRSWEDLRRTLAFERRVVAQFEAADDLDAAEDAFKEREETGDPVKELWGLDVGIASATIAVSALGAAPVSSCNGGQLGGRHLELYPLVAFYLPPERAAAFLRIAEAAEVGLQVDARGIAQIFANSYRDLMRFAGRAGSRENVFQRLARTRAAP